MTLCYRNLNKENRRIILAVGPKSLGKHKVEKLDSALKGKDDKMEKMVKDSEFNIYDEMREREARRLNVVFHGTRKAA